MSVAPGAETYNLGSAPCVGVGLVWTEEQLDEAIDGPVAALIYDDAGKAEVAGMLAGLVETDFEADGVARILDGPEDFEAWRVGEAIAETYLSDHRNCTFPWPDSWDERKGGSSLPGADLVGLQTDGQGDCFAFGEVKTSAEEKYPPQAMYGRTGLKKQIEDLRDRVDIRDNLVRYLGHRASSASWKDRYEAAARRYLASCSDVRVYGVLVRDVEPHENDLRTRVEKLGIDCPAGTVIELLSLYLPTGSIEYLVTKTKTAKEGGTV